jgi:hypothetical protein
MGTSLNWECKAGTASHPGGVILLYLMLQKYALAWWAVIGPGDRYQNEACDVRNKKVCITHNWGTRRFITVLCAELAEWWIPAVNRRTPNSDRLHTWENHHCEKHGITQISPNRSHKLWKRLAPGMSGRSYQTKPGLPSGCQVNIKCFYAKSTCLGSNYRNISSRNISSLTLVQDICRGLWIIIAELTCGLFPHDLSHGVPLMQLAVTGHI